ncbi:MAG: hypothetical protein AAGI72_23510 [Pseudomonadota bacterium]
MGLRGRSTLSGGRGARVGGFEIGMRVSGTIAVWFSCGAASAIAVQETLRQYPDATVRVVNSPVLEEDPDNRRFADDVAEWLGVKIETACNPKYPGHSAVDVWEQRQFMSSPYGAPCTLELKKEARRQWEAANPVDWHVLGFTYEESARFERFKVTERDNVLPVLIDARLTKPDCFARLVEAGIKLPAVYAMGYPNANCIGCVKATSPTYWNHVRKHHPGVFAARAQQSARLGVRLARYRGDRVFLTDLPAEAQGDPLTNMQSECGLFCEE